MVFGVRTPGDGPDRPAGTRRSPACPLRTPASCWTRRCAGHWTSGCAIRSWPRRTATRWRCLEIPRGLTSAELAGGYGYPDVARVPASMEETFRMRVEALPEATRRLLLLAAADPTGDPALVWRAAARLGIAADAAIPAAEAGLAEFGARIRFRHPLVRSAAYRSASPQAETGGARAPWQRPSIPTPTLSGAPGTELTRYAAQTRTSRPSWNARPIRHRRAAGWPLLQPFSSARPC